MNALLALLFVCLVLVRADVDVKLSEERVVFQLQQGDIEFAFLPEVAPVTAKHIFTLVQLGLYTGNHFFRVDKGFVAQTADVTSGRQLPLNAQQQEHASKTVPLEVKEGVKHHAGVLSMGRYEDPNSGTSSFSILLGDAPHLDMQYTIFAKLTKGMEVLHKLEGLPTKREGIFVMPLERITILNSYWYRVGRPFLLTQEPAGDKGCGEELSELKQRFESQSVEVQELRKKLLP
mmetsp:Transcript_33068/g.83955  ORF Transcript_33068/g.83955 Transcript_33068/m.83955 type:complete len:233 (-) Transcript_33068:68-766(-)|eukprot:CAMPEP_0202858290 /NCGR_PEP_ID=MMETSP1391-20130828/889_1 /ASSEMBLY_ACC=CAM_ASM_000867 /TAXON_ID=1034604 /ORGANISM="Chlamydomonas leiostraca, Strain SAG 11-49" /LENGTH=232 /DNA_ID=CAMNT_0049537193 /DNA_START=18 /DNA_END=716 /DNA_ORIENTATION=-